MRKLALLIVGLLLSVGVSAFAAGQNEGTKNASSTAASSEVINLKLANYSAPGDPGPHQH